MYVGSESVFTFALQLTNFDYGFVLYPNVLPVALLLQYNIEVSVLTNMSLFIAKFLRLSPLGRFLNEWTSWINILARTWMSTSHCDASLNITGVSFMYNYIFIT